MIKRIYATNRVEKILEEAERYDVVIIGATRDPIFYQVLRESIPDIVAKRFKKPLIIVKASGGIKFWIKRWI